MAGAGSAGSEATMPRIVGTEDVLGGDPRIAGRRVGVYHVYRRYVESGDSPETIATSYDLSVAEVHAALAFAFDNPDEMDAIEARSRSLYEESNRVTPDDV